MLSYYYKDCTPDLSFLTTDDITTCIKHSTITKLDGRASIVSGDWHV